MTRRQGMGGRAVTGGDLRPRPTGRLRIPSFLPSVHRSSPTLRQIHVDWKKIAEPNSSGWEPSTIATPKVRCPNRAGFHTTVEPNNSGWERRTIWTLKVRYQNCAGFHTTAEPNSSGWERRTISTPRLRHHNCAGLRTPAEPHNSGWDLRTTRARNLPHRGAPSNQATKIGRSANFGSPAMNRSDERSLRETGSSEKDY